MISFGWWDDGVLDQPALLELVASHGAKGIEVCSDELLATPGAARRLAGHLDALGLKTTAVDVMCNLVHREARLRRLGHDDMRRGLDLCVELGASVAHCVGSQMAEGVTAAEGRMMIADQMAEMYDAYTTRHGVVLAIENYGLVPELVCRKDDCLAVLDRAGGRVKLVFDTGNFLAVGERAENNLAACYDRIAMCHFKDWTPDSRPATALSAPFFKNSRLGEGVIRNDLVAAMLLERGYDGWVSLESCMHDGESVDQTLARELGLLRRWLTPAGAVGLS